MPDATLRKRGYLRCPTTDGASTPSTATLTPSTFTVMVRCRITGGQGNWRGVVQKRNGSNQTGWNLYASENDTWSFWLGSDSGWLTAGGGNVVVNQWVTVTGIWDGTEQRLYVDGDELVGRAESGVQPTCSTDFGVWNHGGAGSTPSGDVAWVAFWNRGLSQQEVRHTQYGPGGGEADLAGYWQFNGPGDTSVSDLSGNGHEMTVRGDASVKERPGSDLLLTGELQEVETDATGFAVAPGTKNWVENASFEDDSAVWSWNATTGTGPEVASGGVYGDQCLLMHDDDGEWVGASQTLGYVGGEFAVGDELTLSYWCKSPDGKRAVCGIYNPTDQTWVGKDSVDANADGSWTRGQYTYTVSSDDSGDELKVYLYGHYGGTGDIYYDAVQVEKRASATPFADGDVAGIRGIANGFTEFCATEMQVSPRTESYLSNGLMADGDRPQPEGGHTNPSYFEVIEEPTAGNPLKTDYVLHFGPTSGETCEYEFDVDPSEDQPAGTYTLGAWVYATGDWDGDEQLFHSRWYDPSGTELGTTNGGFPSERDTWQYVTKSFDTGTSAVSKFRWYCGYPQQSTTGDVYVTGFQLYEGDQRVPYGDGALALGGRLLEDVTL
ncbi:LamG domain-containing protein [Halorussus halophilus]|uniref:LamG domain-containing protein n=1 Tax=Halorussus halophilus TaxID=2650975 RepID=UPI001787F156|nr:LamG domain-containing protein [Halorussus halophilus]